MTATPINALSAYANAARLAARAAADPQPVAAQNDTGTFSDLVSGAVDSIAKTGQVAEAKVADLAAGKADMVDLVTAVAETELAVETLVTVRDRVISAYQDIMRMPI